MAESDLAELIDALRELTPTEQRWCKYRDLLHRNGYKLRARYQPDWIPECIRDPTKHPLFCEDMDTPGHRNCLDATRIADGAPVMLKFVDLWSESDIATTLASIDDPHNHTISVEGLILLPDDETSRILVTPRMCPASRPPFGTLGEVLELLEQLLEGIEFMHRQNVAHCDISLGNMLMDATRLIPGGHHPVRHLTQDGRSKKAVILTRTEVSPVKYYFIDFGLSVRYASFEGRSTVTGICGQHKDIPELSDEVPYDPFKLDIRQAGETIKADLLDKYWGLECLIPLTKLLRKDDPQRRPDAPEALRHFNRLVASIDSSVAATKLIPRKGFQPVHWVNHAVISKAKGFRP